MANESSRLTRKLRRACNLIVRERAVIRSLRKRVKKLERRSA
jgi:hypothetical protein